MKVPKRITFAFAKKLMDLGKSGAPDAEEALLEVAPKVPDTLRSLVIAGLSDCGTRKCIPFLMEQLTSHKSDTRCSATFAIAMIAGDSSEDILRGLVGSPKWDVKEYAIHLIAVNGSRKSYEEM